MSQSKGRGVWVDAWHKERFSNQGAFGQSYYQRLQSHIKRVVRAEAIQRLLAIKDNGLDKKDTQTLQTQLKKLEKRIK